MQKNQVELFSDSIKKRNKILSFICIILLLSIILVGFTLLFISKNKNEYIRYSEKSNINYKVYLKKNDFFENEYAEEKKQYIASLIDYINANFTYSINTDNKNVDFKYSYYIDAVIDVKEKNESRSLYNYSEVLLDKQVEQAYGENKVEINKNIDVDYVKYNELINKFIDEYSLLNTESTLTVNLHVETVGSCEDFEKDQNKEAVVSLVIPLTTKTMAIDILNDLIENSDSIMLCNKTSNPYIYLVPPIVTLIIDLIFIFGLFRFIVNNRTSDDIYKIELKKIINNYHSYIQKVNSGFDFKDYQLVGIDSFADMLEIRDTLQQPILMVESETKNGVYFMIPSNTKILYVYSLKQSDIEKKLKKDNK